MVQSKRRGMGEQALTCDPYQMVVPKTVIKYPVYAGCLTTAYGPSVMSLWLFLIDI